MKIDELFIALGFKVEGGEKVAEVDKGMEKATKSAAGLTAAVDILVGGMLYLVNTAMEAGMQLNNFALTTGLSTTELQQWQHTAAIAGVSAQEMADAVKNINSVRAKAMLGQGNLSPWILLFGGIPTGDPFVVLEKLREGLQNVSQDRLAAARALAQQAGFSDKFIAMLRDPTVPINALKEMYLLTQQNQRDLVKLAHDWNDLTDSVERLKNVFTSDFAPALDGMIRLLKKGADLLGEFVGWLNRGSPAARLVVAALVGVGVAMGTLATILTGLTAVLIPLTLAMTAFDVAASPVLLTILAIAAAAGVAAAAIVALHHAHSDLAASTAAKPSGYAGGTKPVFGPLWDKLMHLGEKPVDIGEVARATASIPEKDFWGSLSKNYSDLGNLAARQSGSGAPQINSVHIGNVTVKSDSGDPAAHAKSFVTELDRILGFAGGNIPARNF